MKPTLALDLDETLVHTVQEKEQWNLIKDTFADRPGEVLHHSFDDKHHVKVVKRPGVLEFLYEMEKHFRLVIFTAGTRSYATPILDWLDPSGALFAAHYHQDDCTVHRSRDGTESLVKDLRKLGVSVNQVLLLNNRSMSYHLTESLFRISLLIRTTSFSCKERTQTFFIISVLENLSELVFRQSFAGSLKNTSTHRYV